MSTIVQRAPADKPGDAIVSSILTTIASQVERGTYEINNEADDRIVNDGAVTELAYYEPGKMAKVDNMGVIKNGLLSKCSGHIQTGKTTNIRTQVTVETIK